MKKKQNEIFLDFEADNYYSRTIDRKLKKNYKNDFPIRLLEIYKIKPKKVLEIGCDIGGRLNYINEKYGSQCYGIEPSNKAVEDGNLRFKNIKIVRGVFSDIPFDEKFDLIIISFVFHWIDRALLAKCVSEVERLLKSEGFLIIGDFYPDNPKKFKYHHLPKEDIWTYKQDYSKIFLSLNQYLLINFLSTNHKSPASNYEFIIEKDENERIFYCLLMKR